MVACGIYGDICRDDNDCNIIMQYDWRKFGEKAKPLCQLAPHHSEAKPDKVYFIFTGNTEWGIQNLEYDAFTGDWIAAVYRGKKEKYPNYPMFIIDGAAAPYEDYIAYGRKGLHLSLKKRASSMKQQAYTAVSSEKVRRVFMPSETGSTIYQTNIVPNQRKTAVSLSYTVTPMTPPMVLPK